METTSFCTMQMIVINQTFKNQVMDLNKFIFLISFVCFFYSCGKEDTEDGGNSGNGGTTIENESFYTHNRTINNFIVDGDDVAIVDNEGLTIVENGELTKYETINYTFLGLQMSAKMNSVHDMIYTGHGLYIGTTDGHLIVKQDGEFYGAPIHVYTMKRPGQNNDIQAIWEWYRSDISTEFPGGRLRSEIELDEGEFFIRDEWPCLNALDLSTNHCADDELTDFSSLERIAMIGKQGTLLHYPDYSSNTPFKYTPNFNNLPFNKFKQVEYFYGASVVVVVPDKYYFNHTWVSTDNGFAYIKIEQGIDVVIPDNAWLTVTPANSELRSGSIEEMAYLSGDRLIAYSNSPSPMIHYVDAVDGLVCSLNAPGNENINDFYVDFYDLYFAQGTSIYELKNSTLQADCGF